MKMNKEKFMQLAEKAFDEGANIDFYFHSAREKKEAQELVKQLSAFYQQQEVELSRNDAHWFNLKKGNVNTSVFFNGEVEVNV
jgi:hypothetical protein